MLREWGASKLGRLLSAITVVAVALLAMGGASAAQEVPQKPNVILIVTDDMRAEDLAYMPNTGNLIASQGTGFSRAFATIPLCCPSRATILTGLYPHNHQVWGSTSGAEGFRNSGHEESNLAAWLHGAGYRTGLFGKYLNGYDASWVPPKWDRWFGRKDDNAVNVFSRDGQLVEYDSSLNPDEIIAQEALAFIREDSPGPFFAYVAPQAPHTPFRIPDRYADAFSSEPLPMDPAFNEADVSDKPEWVRSTALLDKRQIRTLETHHRLRLRSLLVVDEMVDAIVAALQERGELENTYIFFTSDNGFMLGEHRLRGKKAVYEPSVRIPLVVRGPGVPTAATDRIVLTNDLAPTIAEIAGASMSHEVDGRSLMPLLSESAPEMWRTQFLVEYRQTVSKIPNYYARRDERLAYVEYDTGERELYDLEEDPYQLDSRHNTQDTYLLYRLRAKLEALRGCEGDGCRAAENEDGTAPDTAIESGPSSPTRSSTVEFAFSSTEAGFSFGCSIDGGPFESCSSPKTYADLKDGEHTFVVVAADAAGDVDPTPAQHTWTVDTVAPEVRRVAPEEGATEVRHGANVHASFSEVMSEDSVNESAFLLYKKNTTTPIAATVSYDPARKRATLDPDARLEPGKAYRAVVTGKVMDLAGIRMGAIEAWFFKTKM